MDSGKNRIPSHKDSNSKKVSIILSSQNHAFPPHFHVELVEKLLPKEIPKQIMVIQCNQSNLDRSDLGPEADRISTETKYNSNIQTTNEKNNEIIHRHVTGKFAQAVKRGVELSNGQFILVINTDFPYPEVVPKLINEIISSPNCVVIASRYDSTQYSAQRLPFMRTMISKLSGFLITHETKIQRTPSLMSGCFAISRELLQIGIEGNEDELHINVPAYLTGNKDATRISIKEILIGNNNNKQPTTKIHFNRILTWLKATWHLYLYGRKKESYKTDPEYAIQEKHKSVFFLSKAGRFFTVGASGLVVNYTSSFLLERLVSNIWYIEATFFGILISITTNFILNKVWTFEDRDFSIRHFFTQYLYFLSLCVLGAVIQLSLVYFLVEYSNIQYGISLVLAVCVASLSNFLLNKKITFGEKIWE